MGMAQADIDRLAPFFSDTWAMHKFADKVEVARYQLENDIECSRISLLDSSISRRGHWFVVLSPDDNRKRAQPIYGPFDTPADATDKLHLCERFIAVHARKYIWYSPEVACMPYVKKAQWNQEIDTFAAEQHG